MMQRLMPPLRDVQLAQPSGFCLRCSAELYGDEPDQFGGLCPECWEEVKCDD